MSDDTLLVVDDDGIRTITFNRPDVKNALTAAMRTRLCELLGDADADDGTRAVIVTAVDPVFTAGVDFRRPRPAHRPARTRGRRCGRWRSR